MNDKKWYNPVVKDDDWIHDETLDEDYEECPPPDEFAELEFDRFDREEGHIYESIEDELTDSADDDGEGRDGALDADD